MFAGVFLSECLRYPSLNSEDQLLHIFSTLLPALAEPTLQKRQTLQRITDEMSLLYSLLSCPSSTLLLQSLLQDIRELCRMQDSVRAGRLVDQLQRMVVDQRLRDALLPRIREIIDEISGTKAFVLLISLTNFWICFEIDQLLRLSRSSEFLVAAAVHRDLYELSIVMIRQLSGEE